MKGKALPEDHKNEDGQKRDRKLERGILHAGNAVRLFVKGDHAGVHEGRHQRTENAEAGMLLIECIPVDEDDAEKNNQEADELMPGKFLMKEEGGYRHHNDRPAVITKGRDADSDLLIGFIEEKPADAHGDAGQRQKRKRLLVLIEMKLSVCQKVKHDQQDAADQGAVHDDLIAVQRDHSRDDAVAAEQKQCSQIF